jgi:hypothetical protein
MLSILLGPWAPAVLAQESNCEVIDFNELSHGDAITSLSLFGGSFTLDVTALRNSPAGAVDATAYDTERWDNAGNPPPNSSHDDTQLNIVCNDAANGGLGNCDGIMAVIPDVNFEEDGDDTQGGTITFMSGDGEFEITEYKAVDSDDASHRIILSVDDGGGGLDLVGEASVFGNGSVITVETTSHTTTRAVFEFLGSGGIDDIEVCRGVPDIDIEKKTNGNQADGANDGDVPQIAYGDTVTWNYEVTNTGDIAFSEAEVIVTDDQPGVTPVLDTSSDAGGDLILSPGETWIYTATGQALDLPNASTDVTVVPGCNDERPTYENMGTVIITETDLTDTDPSHYCNPPSGGEGCTPGFWKQEQHFAAWLNPPYAPSTPFSDVFENAFPDMTLLEVLSQGGGKLKALGRHTVAALLNAATADVDYDFGTPADVINAFNEVYPGNKRAYNRLKREFSYLNEQGCPINGKYPPSNL